MRLSTLGLQALAAQTPFIANPPQMASRIDKAFQLSEGAKLLSPSAMLELPRPQAGVANPTGDLAFVHVTQHSLKPDTKPSKKIYVTTLSEDIDASASRYVGHIEGGEAFWLDGRTLAHIVPDKETSSSAIYAVSLDSESVPATARSEDAVLLSSSTLIGHLPPAIQAGNFKYHAPSKKLVFSASVFEDTDVLTVKAKDDAWAKRGTTAQVYDTLYVRHWDKYLGPKHNSLFIVDLGRSDDKWVLGETYASPLKGTGHEVPVEPFGGADDFDVSDRGIVYTTKDVGVNDALHTRQNIYLVPFVTTQDASAELVHLTSGNQGATRSPVFSPSATKVAWLEMAQDGYEADQTQIVVYDLLVSVRYSLDFSASSSSLTNSEGREKWDRSPDALSFSPDGKSLFFPAGDNGRVKVFTAPLPSTPKPRQDQDPLTTRSSSKDHNVRLRASFPVALTEVGAASAVQPLSSGRLLFSLSTLGGPNNVHLISGLDKPREALTRTRITSFAEEELAPRLQPYEDFWFEVEEDEDDESVSGGKDKDKDPKKKKTRNVHGWVVKPVGWSENDAEATWPVAVLIHGGPQGAWEDQWSTRWNPQVFASQGYFVLAINPTGSTTYGQDFTDAIAEDWGGRPFVDLKKGYTEALARWKEIDPERAVAAGGSFGGFAVNWIQSNPEYGFNFKALVTHDGIFDTEAGGYTTEELFFWNHDFGGIPYSEAAQETSAKFNPRRFVDKWNTPHLIIHGELDYRLPVTEGLAAFTALQLRGVPSRLVVFPDENHWVLNPVNSLEWHTQVLGWFDQFVGAGAHSRNATSIL